MAGMQQGLASATGTSFAACCLHRLNTARNWVTHPTETCNLPGVLGVVIVRSATGKGNIYQVAQVFKTPGFGMVPEAGMTVDACVASGLAMNGIVGPL